jgi:hypothetical protein
MEQRTDESIVQTIRLLPNLSHLEPATTSAITNAERQLQLSFADEYKKYLAEFGVISAEGIELTGIEMSEDISSVVSVTKEAWELNHDVPHTMYVIEDACVDGIFVWQDSSGVIYQTSPYAKHKEIAKTLTEYVGRRIEMLRSFG